MTSDLAKEVANNMAPPAKAYLQVLLGGEDIFFGVPLFPAGAALLAFVLAFYALAARERKTPYIVASVYSTLFYVLLAMILGIVAKLFEKSLLNMAWWLGLIAVTLLAISIMNVCWKIFRINNRHKHFRDDNILKNIRIVQKSKSVYRSVRAIFRPNKSYEHKPVEISESIITAIGDAIGDVDNFKLMAKRQADIWQQMATSISLTTSFVFRSSVEFDNIISKLMEAAAGNSMNIQYITAIRHPAALILHFKWQHQANNPKGKPWKEIASKLFVVDAFSPHFGFTDSTHDEWDKRLRQDGVFCIQSPSSFAGVHTATSMAFKQAKNSDANETRIPTLVIYEGVHALADIESEEQYRIFLKHVLPAEKLWGGMITVFIEQYLPDESKALLELYSDLYYESKPNHATNSDM